MASNDSKKLQKDILLLVNKLDKLIKGDKSNLHSENVLQISQQLDTLIVDYMKKPWQVA